MSNVERLTSLEVSCIVGTTAVPIELATKLTRAHDMKERAVEELKMVREEMTRVVDFYTSEHSLLRQHIDRLNAIDSELSGFQSGCLNLLYHRLLSCEASLVNFSSSVDHNVHLPELYLIGTNGSYVCSQYEDVIECMQSDYSDMSDSEDER